VRFQGHDALFIATTPPGGVACPSGDRHPVAMSKIEVLERWGMLADAAALALTVHAHQLRKGTEIPYISHLLAVAAIVLEHGGDEQHACAALLHDAIEDGGPEWEAVIEERFGRRVAGIVRACTDADTTPKPPWRARKEAYLAHLEEVGPDALLVSAADKLHNAGAIVSDLRTHGPDMFSRFNAGQGGTLWYYRALAQVFARLLPGPLSRDLSGAVVDMEKLAQQFVER
jgi:(p)ppGpp synthase/HD superfamily hydrolase